MDATSFPPARCFASSPRRSPASAGAEEKTALPEGVPAANAYDIRSAFTGAVERNARGRAGVPCARLQSSNAATCARPAPRNDHRHRAPLQRSVVDHHRARLATRPPRPARGSAPTARPSVHARDAVLYAERRLEGQQRLALGAGRFGGNVQRFRRRGTRLSSSAIRTLGSSPSPFDVGAYGIDLHLRRIGRAAAVFDGSEQQVRAEFGR